MKFSSGCWHYSNSSGHLIFGFFGQHQRPPPWPPPPASCSAFHFRSKEGGLLLGRGIDGEIKELYNQY